MNDRQIYLNAPVDASPEALEAYIVEACGGDKALESKTRALFAAVEEASEFFDRAPLGDLGDSGKSDQGEKPGTVIGNYKLLQEIGHGGFGTVYMAEQLAPVKRKVALKIIKLGMDTRQVVARFEVERQALAMMDHPNIAKVHDAGATETGRPYFVMELVRGIPITQFCEEQKLETKARLGLFMDVCSAIQHAHQKGIIHRDLKPSNVMVTLHDDKAVAKVIDFGVAKATQQDLTDKTLFTRFEQFIGTPAYMSPEQAQMSGLDIDTRSDIYALGVLLYELLTGTTPFDQKTLSEAGQEEVRRIIREEDPPKPSTRLTEIQKRAISHSEVRVPSSAIDRDLDWIVMKALEKDRTRRYDTATSLAADIQNHLNDEPVSAAAPNPLYRLNKYARRHRASLLTTAAIAGLLVIGTVVSTWMALSLKRTSGELQQEVVQKRTALDNVVKVNRASAFQQAEETPLANSSGLGIARLAMFVRDDPNDFVSAERMLSALVHRDFASPTAVVTDAQYGELSSDGSRFLTVGFYADKVQVWNLAGECEVTLPCPRIVASRFSPNGKHVLTFNSGFVQVWDWKAEECVQKFEFADVTGVLFRPSPNGRLILLGDNVGKTSIWNLEAGELLVTLLENVSIYSGAWSSDSRQVAVGDKGGTLRVWDAKSGQLFGPPLNMQNGRTVTAVDFSPDGTRLVSATMNRTAQVWEIATGERVGEPLYHDGMINDAEFNHDGTLVATASHDGTARVWIADSSTPLTKPLRHEGIVRTADFHPDGDRLLTGGDDGIAQVWDIGSSQTLGPPMRHERSLRDAAFSVDGQHILGVTNGSAQLWPMPKSNPGPQALRQPGHLFPEENNVDWLVLPLAWSSDGKHLLSGSETRHVALWDTHSGSLLRTIARPGGHKWGAFSRDGSKFLVSSTSQGPVVFDVADGNIVSTQDSNKDRSTLFAEFSHDANSKWVVASLFSNNHAMVLDTYTGEAISPPLEHDDHVPCATISPDGSLVATSSVGVAKIWDTATWKCVHLLHGAKNQAIVMARFSPDSKRMVTSGLGGAAIIWDLATGERIHELRHLDAVNYAEFSPDGNDVVTASGDGTARVWDANTGSAQSVSLVHEGEVMRARFSPDGRRIVTASNDHTARLWDAVSGAPISDPLRHDGPVRNAVFDPTGERVATTGKDLPVRIWEVKPAPLSPVPDWVPRWAEAVVGLRINATGAVEKMDWKEAGSIRKEIKSMSGDGYYEKTAKWFYKQPENRTISPFSQLRLTDYVAKRIREDNLESLEEALSVDPGNPLALIAIYKLLQQFPETDREKHNRANFYAGLIARFIGDEHVEKTVRTATVEEVLHIAKAGWPRDSQSMAAFENWKTYVAIEHQSKVLIERGARWSYSDASDPIPPADWNEPEFDDSRWNKGPAKLGFGSDGETTALDKGLTGEERVAFYFRHRFTFDRRDSEFPNPVLILHLLRDDGAVVYLNGQEIARSNMPLGEIGPYAVAASGVGGASETRYFKCHLDQELLKNGKNLIAVEVHQIKQSSSDVGFDLELALGEHPGKRLAGLVANSDDPQRRFLFGPAEKVRLDAAPIEDLELRARVQWILADYESVIVCLDFLLSSQGSDDETERNEWLQRKATALEALGRQDEAAAVRVQVVAD